MRSSHEGVIVRPIGSSLVMCPPLVITEGQIDRIVDAIGDRCSRD
jgi:adenosylmethionine-8-amino-7-oxononanoate aminotransferase